VRQHQQKGQRVGLVPTMGALHAGHTSLVDAAKHHCDRVVTTVFVNPTQFSPNEDLSRYPRTLNEDLALLQMHNCDMVFVPDADTMYPPGHSTIVHAPRIGLPLEGEFRPGHFDGVTTIVCKLFQILPTDDAFFGKKDYQQWCVLRDMAHDLNIATRIHGMPTIRERDGLALSSRNRYLNPAQRKRALGLRSALDACENLFQSGERDVDSLQNHLQQTLASHLIADDQIDYARIVCQRSLQPIPSICEPCVALLAVHIDGGRHTTRLIDNQELDPTGS
ncbi:MAG: pantoate--beta-alanine ligase, partial [Planctomycetota bacterium]